MSAPETSSPASAGEARPIHTEGVDLSIANGKVDFSRVYKAGKRFVIARANQGESLRDTNFLEYAQQSRSEGLLFSAYHFFMADEDPRDDVAAFVEATRPAELDLPIWLDVETQFAESLDGWIQEFLAISWEERR